MKRLVWWSRDALDDARDQAAFIAMENSGAAHRLADNLKETADALGYMAIGRRGRVSGTYEKPVTGLPYIIVYGIDDEAIVILRVIHTSRDWPDEDWPED